MRAKSAIASALLLATALCAPAWGQRLAGARPSAASDEGGMWEVSDRTERQAKSSAELISDTALNDYVRDVTCKVAAEYCKDVRVYIMNRPIFNATMAPNGYTEVWSGLLLRAQNEAELAFVMSHEVAHFERNHTVEAFRAHKTRSNVVLSLTLVVAVAGAASAASASTAESAQSIMDSARSLNDVIYLAGVASYFGFSRANESEADKLGLQRMAAAGYDAAAAPASWQARVAENQASEFKRVREGGARTNVFDSHPVEAERVAALEAQRKTLPVSGELGTARHRAAIRPHLSAWLRDDLRRRDYGQTLQIIDRLAANGEDQGVLNFHRGEAYRLRRGDGDQAKSRDAYLKAAAYPDAPMAVWRELGDARKRDNDTAGARAAYETYLSKAPEAEDAWLVREALDSLDKGA
jgi:beta-barrel assembly-enhancing protease